MSSVTKWNHLNYMRRLRGCCYTPPTEGALVTEKKQSTGFLFKQNNIHYSPLFAFFLYFSEPLLCKELRCFAWHSVHQDAPLSHQFLIFHYMGDLFDIGEFSSPQKVHLGWVHPRDKKRKKMLWNPWTKCSSKTVSANTLALIWFVQSLPNPRHQSVFLSN